MIGMQRQDQTRKEGGAKMDDICIYHLEVRGMVEEDEINAMSPLLMTVERVDTVTTLFAVRADQAGLIGLMRHLHGRGFIFRSVSRMEN